MKVVIAISSLDRFRLDQGDFARRFRPPCVGLILAVAHNSTTSNQIGSLYGLHRFIFQFADEDCFEATGRSCFTIAVVHAQTVGQRLDGKTSPSILIGLP